MFGDSKINISACLGTGGKAYMPVQFKMEKNNAKQPSFHKP